VKSLCIREFGEIHKSDKNHQDDVDKIFVNNNAFEELTKFAESDDKNHRFVKFKKSTVLKVQNFVGVITTKDSTQIEILPKISEDEDDADNSRKTLEKMLKIVNNLPFIKTTKADLQLTNTLLEFVISSFLTELKKIIKKGVCKDYVRFENQEKFLKGSLQTHKQLNEPPHKQHLFHIEYDVYSVNRAENRLILSALLQIIKFSKSSNNQKLSKHFLGFFDEIDSSSNYKNDFDNWSKNRDMNYYQNILPWLKLVLNRQSPFTIKDKNAGISFLLPMEKLFEKYVAKMLRKQLPEKYILTEQKPQKSLANFNGKGVFTMKPDMVISKDNEHIYILDTKWKLIDSAKKYDNGNVDNKKGISQADTYQLFAYGKKYNVKKVVLIYPQWRKFQNSFNFKFDDELSLKVCPFKI
jgi:5-methylcytosine-specific restriction enzyme subunit McrC